jgi:hypothetical protein
MQSQRKHVLIYAVVFSSVLSAVLPNLAWAEEKQWVIFHNNLSQEIKRINITLTFAPSGSIFYESSTRQIRSEEIQGSRKKDDYKQQLDFGVAVDGHQYIAQVRDADDFNIISRDSGRLCAAKILRTAEKNKPTIVKEGHIFLQREIEVPLEVSSKQLSVPLKEPVAGNATIVIYSNNPPAYEGNFNARIQGSLSGSTATENAFLNASITCRNSLDIKDRYLNLSVKPFNDQMASIAVNGKISDILMIGSAKLVVEKIASDSSEMVLALLNGDLVQEKKPGTTMEAGKPFPEFARVELVNRRLLALSDLKKQAGDDGYIVLIFGDFKKTTPAMPGYSDPRLQIRSLTLDEAMIVNTLKKDCEKTIVIGFVCQQLSPSDMYEKWLGRDLDFYVLSDFSNPLDMQFGGVGMEPYGYRRPDRPDRGETLRGQLGLPNETVITTLINGRGELVSINTDAGKELSGSLVQINKLMKENKKAGD